MLCPKKLGDNWLTYRQNVANNILYSDRFRYDVLYHTDISREGGYSNGIPLDRLNWGNYDLLAIDESHNFRNNDARKDIETRYHKLMLKVIKAGIKTKVLMLSATPVNNRFNDLKNQLALAYEGDTNAINENLVGKLVNETQLTRKTIVKILTAIKPSTFFWFSRNPEEFIIKAAKIINEQKATAIIEQITYNMLSDTYESVFLPRVKWIRRLLCR